jgi:hypothetical protein
MSMQRNDRESIFRIWAPASSPWTAWAKPVLFANLPASPEPIEVLQARHINLPPADGHTALVIDLPAVPSIAIGLGAAAKGYRPVPLFNALPGSRLDLPFPGAAVAVDLWPAARALVSAAGELSRLQIPRSAPPAFLLDADRRGTRPVTPGNYDNRSVSLTTDFPSAATLGGAGISDAILISEDGSVAPDLAHTLRLWQNASLQLHAIDPASQALGPVPLRVPRPSGFGLMFQRLLAVAGLRPSPFGGFGATLPLPSAG